MPRAGIPARDMAMKGEKKIVYRIYRGLCAALLLLDVLLMAPIGAVAQATDEPTPGEAERCAHARIEVRTTQEGVSYSGIDGGTHGRIYDELTVTTCLDCGRQINRSSVPKETQETHSSDGAGWCALCGMPCYGQDAGQPEDAGQAIAFETLDGHDIGGERSNTLLTAQEQTLAKMASVDLGDAALTTANTLGAVMCEQTESLIGGPDARASRASGGDRAALEAQQDIWFSTQKVIFSGGAVRRVPTFDMEYGLNGEMGAQRYGFMRDDSGRWVFISLEEQAQQENI